VNRLFDVVGFIKKSALKDSIKFFKGAALTDSSNFPKEDTIKNERRHRQ
jgi:hypothetical protein